MNVLNNAGLFLIGSVFDLYIFIVMLRVVLQWVNADFGNPIFHFVVKLTNAPLKPIRRIIPTIHGMDFAAMALLLLLEVAKLLLILWLQMGGIPKIFGLTVIAFAELLSQLINIFFYSIFALALLSWINPMLNTPIADVLYRLSEPLVRPVRRILPPMGGFDLSPIPVLIILKLIEIVLVQPLGQIGAALAMGATTA